MTEYPHLRNAPIVEALVDFQVELPPDFSPEVLRNATAHLSDFPIHFERRRIETELEATAGQPVQQRVRPMGLQGVWLKTSDEKTVAQFRVDGFTLNRLAPYTRWQEIEPVALRLWQVYSTLTKPLTLNRLALRYINKMALPGTKLEDYILTGPIIPDTVPPNFAEFRSQLILVEPEKKIQANVSQMLEFHVETGLPSLLLDIDVYRAEDLPLTGEDLNGILRSLRDYKNAVFFGSITPLLRREFGEESNG